MNGTMTLRRYVWGFIISPVFERSIDDNYISVSDLWSVNVVIAIVYSTDLTRFWRHSMVFLWSFSPFWWLFVVIVVLWCLVVWSWWYFVGWSQSQNGALPLLQQEQAQ
jgi:hypothetical protein